LFTRCGYLEYLDKLRSGEDGYELDKSKTGENGEVESNSERLQQLRSSHKADRNPMLESSDSVGSVEVAQ
jgi:hypothetical protein